MFRFPVSEADNLSILHKQPPHNDQKKGIEIEGPIELDQSLALSESE